MTPSAKTLLFILIGLGILAVGAGTYFYAHTGAQNNNVVKQASTSTVVSVPTSITPTATAPTATNSTSTLQGRIIDVYPNKQLMTVQATDGTEEIIVYPGSGKFLPSSFVQGAEVALSTSFDEQDGIYILSSFTILPPNSLHFKNPLSDITDRQASAVTVDVGGLNLSFGASAGLPKPAYLVFISPEGQVLAPHFTSMTGAEYSVSGNLGTAAEALKASQNITIPIAAKGLWAVKFVSLPGADLSTIFGFEPPLPTKTLAERDGKLWYFKNAHLDAIGKIQAQIAQCDSACRTRTGNKQTDYLFLGALANPAVQTKLFGRVGTPYKLGGYRLGEQETFFGGITCSNIYDSKTDSINTYRMSLYDWEIGALVNAGGVCNRYSPIDNEGHYITLLEVVQ